LSNTYHISSKGEPALCSAKAIACPLGGDHFSSFAEAYAALAEENSWAPIKRAKQFTSSEQFLQYRKDRQYRNDEISVSDFGIHIAPLPEYEIDPSAWVSSEAQEIQLRDFTIISSQDEVYSATVEHYVNAPREPHELGSTVINGIAIRGLYDEEKNAIHILDGNHRAAAGLLSSQPVLVKLIPLGSTIANDYFD